MVMVANGTVAEAPPKHLAGCPLVSKMVPDSRGNFTRKPRVLSGLLTISLVTLRLVGFRSQGLPHQPMTQEASRLPQWTVSGGYFAGGYPGISLM